MKLDVTVSKTITINTGNYSSAKPSVSLTIKDVDISSLKNVYENLQKIADGMLYEETYSLCDNVKTIKDVGVDHFLDSYEQMNQDIKNETNEAMEELKKISFTSGLDEITDI